MRLSEFAEYFRSSFAILYCMFYVSGINGSLTPFDPRSSQISTATQLNATAAQAVKPTEALAVSKIDASLSATEVAAVQSSSSAQATSQTEDAAVFDGDVHPTTRDLTGVDNALNLGRAGVAMAYQINKGEKSDVTTETDAGAHHDSIEKINSIPQIDLETPHRVNPIQKKYRDNLPLAARKKIVYAQDLMSSPVFTLLEEMPIEVAQRVFKEHKYRHIPILSHSGKLVGVVSDRDFIGLSVSTLKNSISTRMVTNILVAEPQAEIREIAQIMMNNKIGCIPIIDRSAKLVGIITHSDILRAIVNHAPIELWS